MSRQLQIHYTVNVKRDSLVVAGIPPARLGPELLWVPQEWHRGLISVMTSRGDNPRVVGRMGCLPDLTVGLILPC